MEGSISVLQKSYSLLYQTLDIHSFLTLKYWPVRSCICGNQNCLNIVLYVSQTTTVYNAHCQMQSIFVSSTTDATPGVSGVSKDQKFNAKLDFGSFKH